MISVIVPVYNAEKYLSETIESLVNQTYKDLEILLIDDGSTDLSSIICDNYAKKYKCITVYHKKNGGLISAWEFGIKKSMGNYIAFLDADDCINVNTYEACIKAMDKYDCDLIVYGSAREYRKNFKNDLFIDIKYSDKYYKNKNEVLNQFVNRENSFDGFMWNKLWKREFLENQVIDDDGGLVFDALFVWKLLKTINTACYLEGRYHHYRFILTSMSQSSTFVKYYKTLESWEFIISECKKMNLDNEMYIGNSFVVWCNKACQCLSTEPTEELELFYILMKEKLINSKKYIEDIGGLYKFQSKLFIKSWVLYKNYLYIINSLKIIYVMIRSWI